MSQENVEIVRHAYQAYNQAVEDSDPMRALRAMADEFWDPEIEWVNDAGQAGLMTAPSYKGYEGVLEFFKEVAEQFSEVQQLPERYFDAGDQVVVFVRTVATGRHTSIQLDEKGPTSARCEMVAASDLSSTGIGPKPSPLLGWRSRG